MSYRLEQPQVKYQRRARSQRYLIVGAGVLVFLSILLFALVVTGRTRRASTPPAPMPQPTVPTSTVRLVPRVLDGLLVEADKASLLPRAVMLDNQTDARPWSGIAEANLVIESPVEGGITRFLALYDVSATTTEIGAVRSARPYFVDWARGWGAVYFHVGGSPEALEKIRGLKSSGFVDVDEMTQGRFFQRLTGRIAPHSTYTDMERMNRAVTDKGLATSTIPSVWHFADPPSTTSTPEQTTIRIPYGGSYSVTWKYDPLRQVYQRFLGARLQRERSGASIDVSNVILIKTDARVLDEVGRLFIRTTGGGEAVIYRDGKKYIGSWQRSKDEPIRFTGQDGSEFLLTRGKTWIHVTTDDRIFAGLE